MLEHPLVDYLRDISSISLTASQCITRLNISNCAILPAAYAAIAQIPSLRVLCFRRLRNVDVMDDRTAGALKKHALAGGFASLRVLHLVSIAQFSVQALQELGQIPELRYLIISGVGFEPPRDRNGGFWESFCEYVSIFQLCHVVSERHSNNTFFLQTASHRSDPGCGESSSGRQVFASILL